MNIQPYLEKYNGRKSRHKCPKCEDNFSFAYYLDGNTNQIINKSVGRCNHESSCGYHYTPKQFFIDNPTIKESLQVRSRATCVKVIEKPIGTIPFKYVVKSASYKNDFIYFLCGLIDRYSLESPTIERLMNDYALGSAKDGSIIYWQIDIQGRVRTGKVMKYNRNTGKRIKDISGINWVHSLMKKQGILPEDYNLQQCLFGEHLLKMYPNKTIALVEAEKSALIGSVCFPEYTWLATGGKSQLSIDKLKVLKGRTVIMFPDVDGYEQWKKKAEELESVGINAIVSDVLEKNSTPEDRNNKIDLADWLIRDLRGHEAQKELTKNEQILRTMEEINPAIKSLMDVFSLQLIQ